MWGSCDRTDIGWRTEKLRFVVRRNLVNQLRPMKLGDTGVTLNFGNA